MVLQTKKAVWSSFLIAAGIYLSLMFLSYWIAQYGLYPDPYTPANTPVEWFLYSLIRLLPLTAYEAYYVTIPLCAVTFLLVFFLFKPDRHGTRDALRSLGFFIIGVLACFYILPSVFPKLPQAVLVHGFFDPPISSFFSGSHEFSPILYSSLMLSVFLFFFGNGGFRGFRVRRVCPQCGLMIHAARNTRIVCDNCGVPLEPIKSSFPAGAAFKDKIRMIRQNLHPFIPIGVGIALFVALPVNLAGSLSRLLLRLLEADSPLIGWGVGLMMCAVTFACVFFLSSRTPGGERRGLKYFGLVVAGWMILIAIDSIRYSMRYQPFQVIGVVWDIPSIVYSAMLLAAVSMIAGNGGFKRHFVRRVCPQCGLVVRAAQNARITCADCGVPFGPAGRKTEQTSVPAEAGRAAAAPFA